MQCEVASDAAMAFRRAVSACWAASNAIHDGASADGAAQGNFPSQAKTRIATMQAEKTSRTIRMGDLDRGQLECGRSSCARQPANHPRA